MRAPRRPFSWWLMPSRCRWAPFRPQARRESLGKRCDHLVELIPGQVPVGIGPPAQLEQLVLVPIFRSAGGHHLLGHHVQRPGRNDEGVQVALQQRAGQRGALQHLIPGEGEQLAFGHAADGVSGAAHPLHQQSDGARRTNLADQVDLADVDAQFQRRGGDTDLHLSVFQLLLGVPAGGPGQAAVVGDHRFLSQARRKLMGDSFHQPARVDEDQGDGVGLGESGDGVQGLAPDFVGGDGAKFLLRQLHGQVNLPAAARVHDHAIGIAVGVNVPVAHQEPGHFRQGPLGGGQTDAGDGLVGQLAQPLHRQGQVGAALVVGHGVDLVQDQRMDVLQPPPPALRGQQDVQATRGW